MHAHAAGEPVEPDTPPPRLGPADIAAATFPIVRRNGLDPDQVYRYLRLVADEVAALHRTIAATTQEVQRQKDALADWQTQLAPTHTADGYLARTGRTALPRPLRDTDIPTDEWPPVQPPYPHPYPEQP